MEHGVLRTAEVQESDYRKFSCSGFTLRLFLWPSRVTITNISIGSVWHKSYSKCPSDSLRGDAPG